MDIDGKSWKFAPKRNGEMMNQCVAEMVIGWRGQFGLTERGSEMATRRRWHPKPAGQVSGRRGGIYIELYMSQGEDSGGC
jgi:hypothetical protein